MIRASAIVSSSPEELIDLSLSSNVTVAFDFTKLPADVDVPVIVNVSLLSRLLSVNIGSAIVVEVNPARIVAVCDVCAVKSVPDVAVSPVTVAIL